MLHNTHADEFGSTIFVFYIPKDKFHHTNTQKQESKITPSSGIW